MKKAIYPGSFDPITNGHLDIIERAVHLFEIVIISVARNSDKCKALFSEKERTNLIWGSVSEIPNIEVYIPASPRLVKKMRRMNWFRWVFNWKWVQAKLKKKLESQPAGPEEKDNSYIDNR